MKGKLIKTDVNFLLEDDKGVVIASTSLNKEGLSLSQKNCQAIERGYDLDELAMGYDLYENINFVGQMRAFKAGFQKALELMGDKKFSSGQLLNAMDLVWQWMNGEDYGCKTLTEVQDKHIQSLQQTEWDVEVVMECVIGCQNLILNGENSVCCGDKKPKLDADGCLILKRID